MCASDECHITEQGLRRLQHYAHAHVFRSLLSFHVELRVVSLDPGFHVVIGGAKLFSSGCCRPIVSCHRQLNLYPKFFTSRKRVF